MNKYQQQKANARDKAIKYQYEYTNHSYSYGELMLMQEYFEQLARRYGLVKEFKENGIIY